MSEYVPFDDGCVKADLLRDGKRLIIMTFSAKRRRCGCGRKALRALRRKFGSIHAVSVSDRSIGFWQKMQDEGLIDGFCS